MKQPLNKDGTPRKQRTDCKVFLLPEEGRVEFADIIARNPASPNVEQLESVLAKHGVTWARKNLYEFLRGPRLQEFTIAAGVIRNRLLGQTLAAAGADSLHADSRRLAVGYWMTVARAAQEADAPQRPDESPADYQRRSLRARAEMAEATQNLTKLGAIKAGEDKGAIAIAKLQLAECKLKLDREKFEFDAASAALEHVEALKAIAGNHSLSNDERLTQARLQLFGTLPKETAA